MEASWIQGHTQTHRTTASGPNQEGPERPVDLAREVDGIGGEEDLMGTKNALIDAIKQFIDEIEHLNERFDPASRKSSRNFERWGAVDFVAHSAFYADRRIQKIEDPSSLEPIGGGAEVHDDLRYVFDKYADSTWDEVVGAMRAAIDGLHRVARAHGESDLESLDGEGQPIWRGIAYYGILHSSEHIAHAMVRAGNKRDAVNLQRRVTESLVAINNSDHWVGTVEYNLAKVLALAGDAEAVTVANSAVKRIPELARRAEQDEDFESIRDRLELSH